MSGSGNSTQTINTVSDIASRRILRMALGTALSMGFSQIINWPVSFIAAIFTLLMLSLPLPAPTLKSGLKFVLALVIPAYAAMLLIPLMETARWSGVLVVTVALYGSFYYSARGGSPLIGMFMTLGLTMVVTVGSVSADANLMVVNGIAIGATAGIAFVVIAHALLPDLPPPEAAVPAVKPAPPPKPCPEVARRNAFRSLAVVLPLVLVFLFMSSSTSYVVVMIKVASMGQQANAEVSRTMGKEQIESTVWGGIGAIITFWVMSAYSSLLLFCLLTGLACLIYGKRIFMGPGMHPRAGMWSYALMTMLILVTPAVTNTQETGDASAAFYSRLVLFIVIAFYGTISVAIFNTFWPQRKQKAIGE